MVWIWQKLAKIGKLENIGKNWKKVGKNLEKKINFVFSL